MSAAKVNRIKNNTKYDSLVKAFCVFRRKFIFLQIESTMCLNSLCFNGSGR